MNSKCLSLWLLANSNSGSPYICTDMDCWINIVQVSSNDTLDGHCSVLTLPFQCTDFTVQRIVGRKGMSVASYQVIDKGDVGNNLLHSFRYFEFIELTLFIDVCTSVITVCDS